MATAALSLFVSMAPIAEAEPLTLSQAIERSFAENAELRSIRGEKEIREANRIRAALSPNPTLELQGGTGAMTGSSDEWNLSVGFTQEFLTGGKREKRRDVAGQELKLHRWQLADRERTVREETTIAFLDLLHAQERLKLLNRSIELGRQLLEVARERLAAGDIPELEMNLARVELGRNEGARLEAERELFQSRSRLASVMGLPAGDLPDAIGTLNGGPAIVMDVEELKRRALANRPDIRALEAQRSLADAEIALARSESIPNLTTGIEVRRETSSMEIGGVKGRDTSYGVALRLSIPIPLSDTNQGGIHEAVAKRSVADTRLVAATKNVEREVEEAVAAVINAGKMIALYRSEIIPQLEENLKLTQEAYRLGEVGIQTVIQEQKTFVQVGEAYLTALLSRQKAVARLESAVATAIDGGEK